MAKLIPCDLHIHPDYSIDAEASIEDYCIKALELNLPVIGFSTHFDINPARNDVDPFMMVDGEKRRVNDYTLGRYIDDCMTARERFPDLKILIGMEVDYFPGVESEIQRLNRISDFDYLIGSVHIIEGVNIAGKQEATDFFNATSLEKLADLYFELLYNAANCGLFTVIGHADYYLIKGLAHYGQDMLEIYKPRLEKIIEAMVKTKTGFEINTSYRRHGGDSFFPQTDFIRDAIELGATFNSIGSDSHNVNHLGVGIAEAIETLSEIGIHIKPFYESDQA